MLQTRRAYLERIETGFQTHPIIALVGSRQSGKTTLARQYIADRAGPIHYFDLEKPSDLNALSDPELTLSPLDGLIVIDEVQRRPDLFPLLRYLIDQSPQTKRFLILGSASAHLTRQSAESLAGRIESIEVHPFSLQEVQHSQTLWLRGGYPRAYLASDLAGSLSWREQFIQTFLEQDLAWYNVKASTQNMRRFWTMLAHYHGGLLNASELGCSLNLSHNTIRHYIDLLTDTFMIRQLQPYHVNLKKRQVKSPKLYFRDSGLLHALLGIDSEEVLRFHPKLGNSWEGFALEQVIRYYNARPADCYFWQTHNRAELDLILCLPGKTFAFEFKYTATPKRTKSMKIAMEDLNLASLTVVYPGEKTYPISQNITATPLSAFQNA